MSSAPTNPGMSGVSAAVAVSLSADSLTELLRRGVLGGPTHPGPLASIGQYDVLRVVGSGGMGLVLLARNSVAPVGSSASSLVAIKILRPELLAEPRAVHRFLSEARHMQRLAHPCILPVLDVSDRPEGPFFVMQYMERGSLAGLIRPGLPLERQQMLRIARDVADALRHAHAKGIIHRDLKPGNVLLDESGRAYLADFGLLRTVYNDSVVDVRRDQCEGTAPYMSPSVAAGQAEDTRCDIYSFGALLYEMLTGDPPYEGVSPGAVIQQVLAGPPKPIRIRNPQADEHLALIAEAAMARELRERYASMADVVADLERIERGARPLGPRGSVAPRRTVRVALLLTGVAVLILIVWAIAPALRGYFFAAPHVPVGQDDFIAQHGPFVEVRDDSGDPVDRTAYLPDTIVGSSSAPVQFELTNKGRQPLKVSKPELQSQADGLESNFDAQLFASSPERLGDGGVVLLRGESCALEVRFRPALVGRRKAFVTVVTNDPNDRSVTLVLSGYAKAAPGASVERSGGNAGE